MDKRVAALWTRIMSFEQGETMPIVELRDEVLRLHGEIEEKESRIALMRMFNLLCDLAARHLERMGGDLRAFEAHRGAQIWMFLRAECLVGGALDRAKLAQVTDREIRAGRMAPDDRLRRYALGDDSAFDDMTATLH